MYTFDNFYRNEQYKIQIFEEVVEFSAYKKHILCVLIFFVVSFSKLSALPYCLGPYDPKTWKNCYGIATLSDEDIYIGEFKDLGLAYGRYLWKSGASYVGENRNGKRHGKQCGRENST